MKQTTGWIFCLALCLALMLQGCATGGTVGSPSTPAGQGGAALQRTQEGLLIPSTAFAQVSATKQTPVTYHNELSDSDRASTAGRAVALTPQVQVYVSPSFARLSEGTELDASVNTKVWETFLKKYNIPFATITGPDKLETLAPGVLVLPSLVTLSDREKQAILKYRGQGGSVLSTWLTGVRDERGTWQGFSFMKTGLNVDVVGDTQAEEQSNFLMVYGDSPMLHSLLAGQRIWLERLSGIYPLRLKGQQAAAQIMDWSRLSIGDKVNTTIVFGEHRQPTGISSRSVVLGYPERLWRSADPKAMEAIAHNAITWLFRQPDTRLAAWPHPYQGALSIAVDAPDVVDELDVSFAERVEAIGGRATFYPLSINAAKSATTLKKLQARGHELGYMADRYEGFEGQPTDQQSTRLKRMAQEFAQAGLSTGPALGISPPLQSKDKTTQALINQMGFMHYVGVMHETDGRLPVLIPRAPDAVGPSQALVMLPRTQSGPEDLMAEGDPDEGLQHYLAEFESALPMGGLLLVRFPNQTLLSDEQLDAIFGQMNAYARRLWVASGGTVASWWVERHRIAVRTDVVNGELRLSVTVNGSAPLLRSPSVRVNLPYANDTLKIVSLGSPGNPVSVQALDPWRVAISLGQLTPGTHHWRMAFERSPSTDKK